MDRLHQLDFVARECAIDSALADQADEVIPCPDCEAKDQRIRELENKLNTSYWIEGVNDESYR